MAVDQHGFIWLASGANLWRYDGNKIKSFDFIFEKKIKQIKKIHCDSNGVMWIGTTSHGLVKYHQGISTLISSDNASNFISTMIGDDNDGLWIGTDKGLMHMSPSQSMVIYPLISVTGQQVDLYITSMLNVSDKHLLIATKKGLYQFDKQTHTFEKIHLQGDDQFIIFSIYQDYNDNIWLGTQKGVFLKKDKAMFNAFLPEIFDHSVPAISVDEKNIWVGSFVDGLYRISQKTHTVEKYNYDPQDSSSISNDNIISITSTVDGQLWINTYSGGINYFNTHELNFGRENNSKNSVFCSQSRQFNDFDHFSGFLWVTSNNGLLKVKATEDGIIQSCELYQLDQHHNNVFKNKSLRSTTFSSSGSSSGQAWLATTKGLNKFDPNSGIIDVSYESLISDDVFFIYERSASELLVGTIKGLYVFDPQNNTVSGIKNTQEPLKKAKIYWYVQGSKGMYVATNAGLAIYNEKGFYIDENIQRQLPTTEILSLYIDDNQGLWVGTSLNGLFHFDVDDQLIQHTGYELPDNISIYSIIADNHHRLWMGTDSGLATLDLRNHSTHLFHKSDGLQGETFDISSAYNGEDGKLYFGGLNGFNAFFAQEVSVNDTPPNIVLTDFFRFGQPVAVGDQRQPYVLNKPINDLNALTLTHKDYVIGFEFAALDYADAARNRYAYKLEGLDPDWNTVDADDRKISYSNLQPGQYVFKVKGSNKDGVWNEQGKALAITVLPAPWLSWWAYTIYVLIFCGILYWLIDRKNRANQKITTLLRTEVAKQTQQLQLQKRQVEKLLAKKNELFANVSHEFRTPLTLILGPINQLLKSHLPLKDLNKLKMVQRNASRLLTMIEQLLQLAKSVDNKNIAFNVINTKSVVNSIVESFLPLATNKKITLTLKSNHEATIKVTDDALSIILGNLLSNAIKYTPIGGHIEVSAVKTDDELIIKITDSGCGLDEQQQNDIFDRFKRLDSHQNIAGIGIGLSVVKEVLNVNNGSIDIESRPGEGSTFIVRFSCSDEMVLHSTNNAESLLLTQLTTEMPQAISGNAESYDDNDQHRDTVLIIEDNNDMRAHIAEILMPYYRCIAAQDGKQGIVEAIQQVPDVIICDVMMPEMDGFHVSRVIRSDSRTSHIPLVLLTALEDKDSRMRGLREHVDVYLTKPFDAQELLLQLENILVIRSILNKKVSTSIQVGRNTSHADLSKKDQQFIDKLNQIIIKKYQDPGFLRPQMASAMALSERQLQRKLKALIDKNPMDLLREYRLAQAAEMLKDGFQVGVTSDQCGFNSVTYFSQCFKAQFGMAPKVYQKSCQ